MLKSQLRIALTALGLVFPLAAGAAAQALPDPPRADRQPAGLSAPRIAPLPESQWTAEHRRLAARYARDGRPTTSSTRCSTCRPSRKA